MKTSTFVSAVLLTVFTNVAVPALAMEKSIVSELADRWSRAYNANDIQGLREIYSENAHLYLHQEPRLEGRENIIDFWAQDMETGSPRTILNVTNFVEGFDMTLVHGNYQVVDRSTGAILGSGRFAHIWIQDEEGHWQLDRDLWNQPVDADK